MMTDGTESNFWYRVAMDLLNLFSVNNFNNQSLVQVLYQGVLVFLVLVCKAKLVKRMMAKMRGARYQRVESTMTTFRYN